jgi:hypothetical protein
MKEALKRIKEEGTKRKKGYHQKSHSLKNTQRTGGIKYSQPTLMLNP